jgi:hypothetical protein
MAGRQKDWFWLSSGDCLPSEVATSNMAMPNLFGIRAPRLRLDLIVS